MKEHGEQEAGACSGLEEWETNSLDNAAGTRTVPPARTGQPAVPTTPETRGAQQHAAGLFTLGNDKSGSSFHPFGRRSGTGTGTGIWCVAQSLYHKTLLSHS